jgi:hypothetical protein
VLQEIPAKHYFQCALSTGNVQNGFGFNPFSFMILRQSATPNASACAASVFWVTGQKDFLPEMPAPSLAILACA